VLRHLREQATISQEDMAALADIDRTHVGSIERDETSPTIGVVHAMLHVLKASWAQFGKEIDRAITTPQTRPPTT
jgi:transcriptional regulator with XRE-family HTH domain